MPLYAGMPWNELERAGRRPDRADVVGRRARARARRQAARAATFRIYFLEYNRYFDRPYLYGPPAEGYPDNLERFTFLSRGSLELCKALGFFPDVIHCNDWQTALVPVYVNTVEWMQPLHAAATVYSIHNLAYQGVFDGGGMFITGLGRGALQPARAGALRRDEPDQGGARTTARSCRRSARPTRARSRRGAYGCGLDGVLARAQRRSGRHPQRHRRRRVEPGDRHAPAARRSTPSDMAGKAACKAALQKEAGLAVRPDVPLFGVVGRLTPQKGFDVLAHALDAHPELGRADRAAGDRRRRRRALLRAGPTRTAAIGSGPGCGFDNGRAHRIEAGCRLLPDAVALRALRPQPDVQPALRDAAGRPGDRRPRRHRRRTTTRRPAAAPASCSTISTRSRCRTPSAGRSPPGSTARTHRRRCDARAMAQDFSWERAASAYRDLYLGAYERRRGHAFK